MRIFSVLMAFLFISIISYTQSPQMGEFATNTNGLMYSDQDIKHLRFIVDSLNLKFKSCDLNQEYSSMPQGRFFYARFTSKENDLRSVLADIDKISFQDLVSKHDSLLTSCDTSSIIIKTRNGYLSGTPAQGYNSEYLGGDRNKTGEVMEGKWLFTYTTPEKYFNYFELRCYYFPEKLRSKPIPKEYALLIQYVDCMVDTSEVIFKPLTKTEDSQNDFQEIYNKTNDYLNTSLKIKNKGRDRWIYHTITIDKAEKAIEKLSNDDYFRKLVVELNDAAISAGTVSAGEEKLIANFVSFKEALTLKRSRRVVGMCSMDKSPRIHAHEIALLAAKAHSWDIFLRAHLDIMNDRFDRRSDLSLAWNGRKTYLKELEELDLNIVDLMLGLSLRAANLHPNHYYGTVWRIGWALSESKEKELFEKKAIAMMKDNRLDEFNRGLMFMLYWTYTTYLENEIGKEKRNYLREQVSSFPDFLQSAILQKKEPKKD